MTCFLPTAEFVPRPSPPTTDALTLVPPPLPAPVLVPPKPREDLNAPIYEDEDEDEAQGACVLGGDKRALDLMRGAGVMVIPLGKEGLLFWPEGAPFPLLLPLTDRAVERLLLLIISAAVFLMGLDKPSRAESSFWVFAGRA